MRRTLAFLVLWILALPAGAQPDPGEALYHLGRQLLSEGKTPQAIQKLEESIRVSPNGPLADDALLAAATLDYPASSLEDLGRAAPAGITRARARLETIAKDYRASSAAPAALFRLGLLQMDPANPRASLDEAYATFLQVERLYPRSPEAADAIYAAGTCQLLQGDRDAAAGEDTRLVVQHGSAPSAERARLRLAVAAARNGETSLAHRLLGSLTEGDPTPEGETSAADPTPRAALSLKAPSDPDRPVEPVSSGSARTSGRGALVVRAKQLEYLFLRASQDRPDRPGSRILDTAFQEPTPGAEILALVPSREGILWALDGDSGRAFRVGASTVSTGSTGSTGETAGTRETAQSGVFERSRGLAWDARGSIVRWDERGILRSDGQRAELLGPPDRPGEPGEPLRKIAAISTGPFGEIDVLDGGGSRLLRYGPDRMLRGQPVAFEARPSALARSEDGTCYVLVPSRHEIHVVPGAFATRARRSVLSLKGPGWDVSSPGGIALDPLGRIYVLDTSARSVTVLDERGRRVALIAPVRGTPGEIKSPTAIAVDPAGHVYVADRRTGLISRFK